MSALGSISVACMTCIDQVVLNRRQKQSPLMVMSSMVEEEGISPSGDVMVLESPID